MKKVFRVTAVVALLLVAFSAAVLAKDWWSADINYGDARDDGSVGFVYSRDYQWDEESESYVLVDSGDFQPIIKMRKGNYWNRTYKGAYVTDGQELTTVVGTRLGVNYSPYVARFDGKNRLAGMRVYPIAINVGPAAFTVDGTWAFGKLVLAEDADYTGFPLPTFKADRNDLLVNVKGSVYGLNLNGTVAHMYNVDFDRDVEESETNVKYYQNFSVGADMEVIPGFKVTGLYARYGMSKDYLYEVTASYDVIPGTLNVYAGHRDSTDFDVENGIENKHVLGGESDAKQRYLDKKDDIEKIYKRDFSINVGAKLNVDYDITSNTIQVDYDTTNPDKRGDLDDKVTVKTKTNALDFIVANEFSVMFVDDETTARQNDNLVAGATNRMDYALDVTTPKFKLPVPMVNEVFAIGRVNFDWDKNYVDPSRSQTIVALELGIVQDIWKVKNLELGAILGYDMPSDEAMIEDAFKYALRAKYDAPNGFKFRLEYQSSTDYTNDTDFVHDKPLNDRYDTIRYYDNSKFHGIRLSVGVPF